MEVKKIFSKRVFEELMALKKHRFLNTQDNLKCKGLQVYVFVKTPELIRDFTEITSKYKQTNI
jgi:hypothetical protein